ncbi:AAA-like domain-containing protein [Nodosilinea nodulosa]|uniref:AAA-like domain-containing protein n=1 Tax=Nodosilinea nodulosa TaxID=416001 RepID=UPI00031A9B48|nr:AAA-like domain-containing protein [Nodosilinea nodulosa]
MTQGIQLFFSYSHRDEALRDELAKHLSLLERQGVLSSWHDRQITPGSEWAGQIDHYLEQAQIILLLVSADFLASNYCYDIELNRAMKRHADGDAVVIPVLLRSVDWQGASFRRLQALPKNAKPVTTWANQDEAFTDIAKGIRKVVEGLRMTVAEAQAEGDSATPGSNTGLTQEPNLQPSSAPADLEIPEGQVPLSSPFYVERPPIEADCYRAILQPSALIRIKAPRQMGKSSLMARILNHASQHGDRTVSISFQEADGDIFAELTSFLQWFCATIADALGLPDQLDQHWDGPLGSKQKCGNYFYRYILPALSGPLALGLDEVDLVFQYPKIAEDFFALLRAWHEKRNDPLWQRLRLIITHSKEVYVPLKINQSPFNVGLAKDLPEFTAAQVSELAARHGLSLEEDVVPLMEMLGGHPYLIRVALYHLATGRFTLPELLAIAPTEEGPYAEHLRRHLQNLEESPDLLAAMQVVLQSKEPTRVGSKEAFRLQSKLLSI